MTEDKQQEQQEEQQQGQQTALTIFDLVGSKEREQAIRNLLRGKTPPKEIRRRDARGGGQVNYVNTYYMTRQISLLTGFRWSSECLEERTYPNWEHPREVGAKMRVTVWDTNGNCYSHISWGQKDVSLWSSDQFSKGGVKVAGKGDPIALFDDLKAAYSDGIKKCLSYFGIANDVYGGKELEYFAEPEEGEEPQVMSESDAKQVFGRYLRDAHIKVSDACKVLGVSSISEVQDYADAYRKLKAWKQEQ